MKKRIVNKELTDSYIGKPCLVCGTTIQTAAHHIKHKGGGGHDIEWNLMPLCWGLRPDNKNSCHDLVHKSLKDMAEKYKAVYEFLIKNEWIYCDFMKRYWHI